MENFWDQDNSFTENTHQLVNGQWVENQVEGPAQVTRSSPKPRPRDPAPVAPEPDQDQYQDLDLDLDAEDDFTEVLSDARLRLEQGRLYEMIMNHDLFGGLDADPKAIRSVEREMKRFARERMEIMLGMRQENPVHSPAVVSSPFNDLEVDILKKLASKATNGATAAPEANQVAATLKERPKQTTLNSISRASQQTTPAKPLIQKKPAAPASKPLQTKAAAPVRKQRNQAMEAAAEREGIDVNLLEPDYKPINKPIEQLSEAELQDRQRQAAERQHGKKAVPKSGLLPIPTYEQEQMIYQERSMNAMDSMPAIAAIINRLNSAR